MIHESDFHNDEKWERIPASVIINEKNLLERDRQSYGFVDLTAII